MNYYHMQLHPDDIGNYSADKTLKLLEKGYIGIDVNPTKATNIGCNDKPFDLWTKDDLNKFEKENEFGEPNGKWKSQIETFRNIQIDDIVIVRRGKKFIALTKVIGKYSFVIEGSDGIWFRHRFPVKILQTYRDFSETIKIPKPYQTIETSKSGKTFNVIRNIYQNYIDMITYVKEIDLLKSNKNLVLTGAPGTGKTYLAKKIAEEMTGSMANESNEQYSFVQFHPSYDYTDFVEGLRPKKEKDSKELGFELKNGIFKEFCKKAKGQPEKDFVFIIDEINRAEISKVFGELFFAIDPGYRGEEGKVKTQYANMQTEETFFTDIDDDYFFVPSNVYVIASMNDIDRSVESFDFAMRRRFAWIEIKAEDRVAMLDEELKEFPKLIEAAKVKMKNLNNIIFDNNKGIEGLNSSYHIGPAYFLKLLNYKDEENPWEKLWENHLKVLLREYMRGMPKAEDNLKKLEEAYNLK